MGSDGRGLASGDRSWPTPSPSTDAACGQTEALVCALLGQLGAYSAASLRHSFRVARKAGALGRALHLGPIQQRELHWSALLHDIGKLLVPLSILNKPTSLTPEERCWVNLHARGGAALLGRYGVLPPAVVGVARHHHDAWEGPGITLPVRIVAVTDVYDALISERPYKPAWTREAALAELWRRAGRCLDPELVALFAEIVERGD